MYYRRCEPCGAKALATATRCPRCEAAFELNDEHNKRHRLVPCRSCKVVQPATETTCRWCGTVRTARSPFTSRQVTLVSGAVAAAALLFASRGAIVPVVQASFTSVATAARGSSESTTPPVAVPSPEAATPTTSISIPDAIAAREPTRSMPSGAKVLHAATPTAAPSTDVQTEQQVVDVAVAADVAEPTESVSSWEEAKAMTWVNVRADRSRDATILAVLNPDEIVRLGAKASGWRQVNVDGATGWVDGRHFVTSRQ